MRTDQVSTTAGRFETVTTNGQHVGPLNRSQIMDRIISINPTATVAFLSRFEERPLKRYLEHLTAAQEPRGRSAWWVRPADSPAIVVRVPRG